ncbi:unnamed protein product [Heterotrigona itama]|uniref:Uncharacterized protein n=1 Tax=Heterotrigona itama TaxID=395501 RepID=A0A6V7HCZ3_9HYME|nr:unnamed protein product [Heterotrigona itama]
MIYKEAKRKEDRTREKAERDRQAKEGDCHAVSVVATGAPLRSTIDFPRFFTPQCTMPPRGEYQGHCPATRRSVDPFDRFPPATTPVQHPRHRLKYRISGTQYDRSHRVSIEVDRDREQNLVDKNQQRACTGMRRRKPGCFYPVAYHGPVF